MIFAVKREEVQLAKQLQGLYKELVIDGPNSGTTL